MVENENVSETKELQNLEGITGVNYKTEGAPKDTSDKKLPPPPKDEPKAPKKKSRSFAKSISDVMEVYDKEIAKLRGEDYANKHYLELSCDGLVNTVKESINLKRQNLSYTNKDATFVYLSYPSMGSDIKGAKEQLERDITENNTKISEGKVNEDELKKYISDKMKEQVQWSEEMSQLEVEIKSAMNTVKASDTDKEKYELKIRAVQERLGEIDDYLVKNKKGAEDTISNPTDESHQKLANERKDLTELLDSFEKSLHDTSEQLQGAHTFLDEVKGVKQDAALKIKSLSKEYEAKLNSLTTTANMINSYKKDNDVYQKAIRDLEENKMKESVLETIIDGASLDILAKNPKMAEYICKQLGNMTNKFAIEIKSDKDGSLKLEVAGGYKLPDNFEKVELGVYEKNGAVTSVQFTYIRNGISYSIPLKVSVVPQGKQANGKKQE